MNWFYLAVAFILGFAAGFFILVLPSSRIIGNAYSMGWRDGSRNALQEGFHAVVVAAKEEVFGPN